MSFGTNLAGPPENAAKFSSELPAESVPDGWKPRHFHEVVAVSMVIRQWMKPRDRTRERLSAETDLAVREVNASLVFEPMPVTLERVRALQQRRQAPPADHQDQAVHVAKPSLQQMDNSMPMTGHLSNGRAIGSTEVAEPAPPEEAEGVFLGHMRKTRTKLIDWGTKAALLPQTAVDPTGLFYCYWTLLVYAVFLYNSIACVLFVFDDTQKDQQVFTRWTTLNVFGDFINLADLFINLRLSYLEDGLTVDNLIRLAKRYFRNTHFLFDVVALAPTDLLLLLNPNLSLVRVNRMAKYYRAMQLVQMTDVRTNYPNAFRILHILIVCMILFHWNAAVYFKVSFINGIFSLDFTAWEFNYVKNQDPIWADCITVLMRGTDGEGDKCIFDETNRGDPETERPNYVPELAEFWQNRSTKMAFSNFSKQYSLSFYWSSLTLTTSGQQPYPTAAMHNFLEIFDTIVGVLVFSVIVGSVGNAVSTMNLARAELQQLNDGIKFYMNYRNVADAMQKRVLDCLHYIRRHAQIQDERAIMGAILPARLRGELAVHLHLETISRVQLFSECETSLLYELVLRLKMHMFAPNDFLCRRGDLAREMFVLKRGVLEVASETGEVKRLESGATFGEMSVLKPVGPLGKLLARRCHSLRSLGYSEVYLLCQEDALEVFADYPEQRQQLISRATQLLLERGEIANVQLVEPGPLAPLELCGTESATELLQLLGNTLKGLDAELDALYDKFTVSSSELKQQITVLEGTYQQKNWSKIRN